MAQENEASVEEILESIKKVIARDNRSGAVESRRRRGSSNETESARTPDEDEDKDEDDDNVELVLLL